MTALVAGDRRQRPAPGSTTAGARSWSSRPARASTATALSIEQIFGNLVDNAVKYLRPVAPGADRRRAAAQRRAAGSYRGRRQWPRHRSDATTSASSSCSAGRARRTSPARASAWPSSARCAHRLGGDDRRASPSWARARPSRIPLPPDPRKLQETPHERSSPSTIVMIEDDDGHARLIEKNIRRAGINNEITPFHRRHAARSTICSRRRRPGAQRPGADPARPQPARHDAASTSWPRSRATTRLKRTPVVVLTTTDDKIEIQRCYDLGCNVYITKPVNYESFAERHPPARACSCR